MSSLIRLGHLVGNIDILSSRSCHMRPLSSSCFIFLRPTFLQLQLKEQIIQTFIGFDVQRDIFCRCLQTLVCRTHGRSLRDLGLAALTRV